MDRLALLLAAGLVASGCASSQTPESLAAEQERERDQLEAKQASQQEALAKDEAKRQQELETLKPQAASTLDRAKRELAGIDKYFESAVGYVVFPKIAKGGLGIGAAHGDGVVYERRKMLADKIVGMATVTQASIGLQIGGQTFSEIVFFENAETFENFKKSNVEFSGEASGVAGGEGGTAAAKYENGVAIFVFGEKGLMGQASIGGQKFTYWPAG